MPSCRLLMLTGAVLIGVGISCGGRLPMPSQLSPLVRGDPLQTPTDTRAFALRSGGIDYRLEPLFDYDIAGLVVSLHDSATWWDTIHADTNDYLNVADLCLVWGANAADGAYRHMYFHSAQFTCYFGYADDWPVRAEDTRAVSNNHLLTTDAAVARAIRGLRVGDQVRLRGRLANYSHNAGFPFHRGSSITRDDAGCEIILIDQLDLLGRASSWPRWLVWCGVLLLLAGLVVWYRRPNSERDW